MRTTILFSLLASSLSGQALLAGCVEACDTSVQTGLGVTVVGGGTPAGKEEGMGGSSSWLSGCAAIVTTSPVSQDFECWTEKEDCLCAGFNEQGGAVTVTVELEGETETQRVEIEEDECHVLTENVCFFGEC